MTINNRLAQTLLISLLLIVAGCSQNEQARGIEGTGGTFSTKGSVTGFGSIWINGIEVETSQASIYIEDEIGSEDQLQAGMQLQLQGVLTDESYSAQEIYFSYDLVGEISQVQNTQDGQRVGLEILGQSVMVTEDSILQFAGTSATNAEPIQLQEGTRVAISGFVKDEFILATYVQIDTELSDRVSGYVDSIDNQLATFNINEQVIDFADAQIQQNLALEPGRLLRVNFYNMTQNSGHAASIIEIATKLPSPGQQVKLEGLIDQVISENELVIDQQHVDISLVLNNQTTAQLNLNPGQRVNISAIAAANGLLIADAINIYPSVTELLIGEIESINTNTNSFELLGQDITATNFTVYLDLKEASERFINFNSLEPGDKLEVLISHEGENLKARKITRKDFNNMQLIRGFVNKVHEDDIIHINQYRVDISNFESTEFHQELDLGQFVEVKGYWMDRHTFKAKELKVLPAPCPYFNPMLCPWDSDRPKFNIK